MSARAFMSGHTPGPWRYRETKEGDAWRIEHFNPKMNAWGAVATVYGPPPSDEGNALLIASAPQMYRVIVDLVALFDHEIDPERKKLYAGQVVRARALLAGVQP